MSILSAKISIAEGEFAWTGTMELGNPASYQRIQIDDPFTLELGEESFSMIVDNKTLSRDGINRPQLIVSMISPTARFAFPRATPFEKTWDAAIQARDAAEEAVGEAIDWDLINWTIPAKRLSVFAASPLNIVDTIAKSVGGIVETRADGMLRVRHRFPVTVPDWQNTTVSHILTDAADNLSSRESHRARRRTNRVVVRGFLPQPNNDYIGLEIDQQNGETTTPHPGETVNLLAYNNPQRVSSINASTSAGSIWRNPSQSLKISEDVSFSGTNNAMLSKPAQSINSVIWLGENLGVISLGGDGRTISSSSSGVAIARISYSVYADSWGVSTPNSIAGETSYPVQIHVTAATYDSISDGEIVCQRGNGEFSGEDISDPLLATTEAKLSRGRADIDSGEDLQEISLTCIHRPGIMPGHLVEVHDALMGRSWRGKVVSVSHEANGPILTTSLNLVRHHVSG
jgi:hypothetical protein